MTMRDAFGLDLKGCGASHTHRAEGGGRIMPLIFQAKRYTHPTADISQHRHARGYQYTLLSRNDCASAYIFYENETKLIKCPVPPLLKPAARVAGPGRTPVFEGSVDLPTYLLSTLVDAKLAPSADSPDDTLRMIYAKALRGQLAYLAVISSDAAAGGRYATALATLALEFRGHSGESRIEQGID